MTQEEKELLLKDLCARLPYGVKVKYYRDNCDGTLNAVNFNFGTVWITADSGSNDCLDFESIGKGVWQLKPFLRPLSSMTEEEFADLKCRYVFCESCRDENDVMDVVNRGKIEFCDAANVLNWLNAHHFDYRMLIEQGLALPTKNGIYK